MYSSDRSDGTYLLLLTIAMNTTKQTNNPTSTTMKKPIAVALIALWSLGTIAMLWSSFASTPQPTTTWAPTANIQQVQTIDQEINDTNEADATLPSNAVTQDIAAQAALQGKKWVTITATHIGDENGVIAYEFGLSDGTKVNINALDATIMQDNETADKADVAEKGDVSDNWKDNDKETNDDHNEKQVVLPAGGLTQQQAQTIALEGKTWVTVIDSELDMEDGVAVYEFELSDNTEVNINATNGSIIPESTNRFGK